MLTDHNSKFQLYSLGIVVKNKPVNSDIIEVTPIEDFTLADGPLATTKKQRSVNLPNINGKKINSKATSSSIIEATWIPLADGNRITSPNVCANETVRIFRYANTDEYYWNTIFREPLIRRLEEVMYAYSDLKQPLKAFDKNSSYWILWSTLNKKVHIHTSKSDGEPFAYDVIIDTKNGQITVQDDIKNVINLNSKTSTLTVNTNQQIIANTNNATINAHKNCTVNTEVATINASNNTNINTPTLNVSNDVNIGGNTNISGNMSAGGAVNGSGGNCYNGN